MVNENGMVEWWSAGGNLRHAEHSRPPLPRFNGSTPITPQLQPFHPSPPLGLGLVEYIRPLFSPVPGKSKDGKCAIARRGATSFCFLPPLEKIVGKKQHLIGARHAFEAEVGDCSARVTPRGQSQNQKPRNIGI